METFANKDAIIAPVAFKILCSPNKLILNLYLPPIPSIIFLFINNKNSVLLLFFLIEVILTSDVF